MMFRSGYITIIGRPNSGKSTLLNAVLKTQISIVTPKAQTTRDQVLGILTQDSGQIVFIDTPGVHKAKAGGINFYMVQQAREALESPHLIWYLVDPTSALEHESAVIDLLPKDVPVFLLLNKIDGVHSSRLLVLNQFEQSLQQSMQTNGIEVVQSRRISALTQKGVDALLTESWKLIPEGKPYYPDPDQVSDRPTRFFVAEKIRERLYFLLGDEVPYSCGIEIDSFQENTKPPRIEATIHVERESQKGIVIGQGGKKIKEIGQTARKEIEDFLGEKIFLGLRVKVLKDWTQNPDSMRRIGYSPTRKTL